MLQRKLIDYLPKYIQEYREIKEINSTEQIEFDSLYDKKENVLDNSFVLYADDSAVAHYEKMMRIVPKPTETIDERKFGIIVKINEQIPYTMRTLEEKLASLCGKNGYSVTLDNANYKIEIKVELTAKNNVNAVKEMLKRVLPCNLEYTVTLIYNQYANLEDHTHAELAEYTNYELRNEVL